MVKEYAGTFLLVQSDGGVEKGVATAGFVVFSPSGYALVHAVQISAGFMNNEAKLAVIR